MSPEVKAAAEAAGRTAPPISNHALFLLHRDNGHISAAEGKHAEPAAA